MISLKRRRRIIECQPSHPRTEENKLSIKKWAYVNCSLTDVTVFHQNYFFNYFFTKFISFTNKHAYFRLRISLLTIFIVEWILKLLYLFGVSGKYLCNAKRIFVKLRRLKKVKINKYGRSSYSTEKTLLNRVKKKNKYIFIFLIYCGVHTRFHGSFV